MTAKKVISLDDRHVQHVSDGLIAKLGLQNVFPKSCATTSRASHADVGQELHVDLQNARAFALRALSFFAVETEMTGGEVSGPGGDRFGKNFANRIESFHERDRATPRAATDRGLVDHQTIVDPRKSGE